MSLLVLFLILIVLISILYTKYENDKNMVYIVSDVDNRMYMVRNTYDKQRASNVLAIVNKNICYLAKYMYNNKNEYKEYEEYITRLKDRTDDIIIRESSENSQYTSYTMNKGEQIIFCIRSKLIDNYVNKSNIHDINLIMYVALHEISHIACPEFGHTDLFRKIFLFFCDIAGKVGIYKRINFRTDPMEYCGMKLTG